MFLEAAQRRGQVGHHLHRDRLPRGRLGLRRQLINLAYRLLGSPADAENVVQETSVRWYAMDRPQRDAIEAPGAWGLVGALRRPVTGRERAAHAYLNVARLAPDQTLLERTVNGRPGLVAQQDGVTATVFAFRVAGDRITHIWALRNPEKLRPWTEGDRGGARVSAGRRGDLPVGR
ncbi:sigma factor [Streptomyces sp. NPDC056656]|uniref:sigma factor n=1 Tax=Streptomyces sp. NPDC056656 TaxID=3345895 RepID=UPI0036A9EE2D